MSFLAPWALLAAGVAAVALVAAHLVSWRRPRDVLLPTARFVPVDQPPAAARTRAPSDLLLLLARLLLVTLVGLAAAKPVRQAAAGSVKRIVVLDASGAVADASAARDSARARVREGDVLLVADTSVRVAPSADSVAEPVSTALAPRGMPLTAALLAAQREAVRLHRGADSIALVLVGAVRAGRVDGATDSVRAAWPGRIEIVELQGRADSADTADVKVTLVSEDADPLAVALEGTAGLRTRSRARGAGAGADSAARTVRIVRGTPTFEDSAFATGVGATLVHWPRGSAAATLPSRSRVDTVGALVVTGRVAIAPFARARRPAPGVAVAHWVDGEPAATERATGSGCTRSIAVDVSEAGDLVLRPAFRAIVRALARPCGATPFGVAAPLSPERVAALAGRGALAPARAFAASGASAHSSLAPWLWGAAFLVALVLAVWEAVLEPSRRRLRAAHVTSDPAQAPGRAA